MSDTEQGNSGTRQGNQGQGDSRQQNTISAAESTKIKLPDFHEEHTDLWFWQVEAAYDAANITSDKKKYNTIIGQLPTKIMCKLIDLRNNPPVQGQMYKTLKERIIREFADSTQNHKDFERNVIGRQKAIAPFSRNAHKSTGHGYHR